MIKDGRGGANTQTGIYFEGKVDLVTYLHKKVLGYECVANKKIRGKTMGFSIYYQEKLVAQSFKKYELYRFLEEQGIDWKKSLSKRLLPDDAIYVIRENTMHIIEIKYQEVDGSVDEKLQTCEFKLRQYKKLFAPLNYEVTFSYVLSRWFKQPKYKDTLDYIIDKGCKYYFEYLPLHKLGLPVPLSSD